jgi:hypothetical protein
MSMKPDKYALQMGKLLVNLQSLEYSLRGFLWNKKKGPILDLDSLQVGDVVPLNPFTDYSTLGHLVERCDAEGLAIDRRVVQIRDALAHGRIASSKPQGPDLLLKFSQPKPTDTTVRVTEAYLLDEARLADDIRFVREEGMKVLAAIAAHTPQAN